ncbi:glycosyltransferase [Lacticaseibacillus jixianensis]|uniref:Glycosyltransferase n=1 Tax=Lacticaseibacillus jixianensis TaxID=2486012 RepID=A0ABW4BA05_9LACO|nr:glycosyltransferase [Lacticaseibacillus jixianensis]
MKKEKNKTIRVFYMVYSLTSGGIERYSINLFRGIDKSKIELDFITKLDRREFFDGALNRAGGKKIPLARGAKPGRVNQAITILKNTIHTARKNYDIAYFNLSSPSAVFKYPLICRFCGIKKIIIHSHNSSEVDLNLIHRMANSLGRRYINHIANKKFAPSREAASWMFGEKSVAEKDYVWVPNAVESEDYAFSKSKRSLARLELNLPEDSFIVGHVGRFVEQKNHIQLINIFEALHRLNNKAILLLVGVGELQDAVREYVAKKNLSKSIRFLGERADIAQLMQAMDVFLLPSLYEGLPVVGIEAQAAGLPCLFSDTISKEVGITKNTSFMSLKSSPHEWAKRIQELGRIPRTDTSNDIKASGYDLSTTVQLVENQIETLATT